MTEMTHNPLVESICDTGDYVLKSPTGYLDVGMTVSTKQKIVQRLDDAGLYTTEEADALVFYTRLNNPEHPLVKVSLQDALMRQARDTNQAASSRPQLKPSPNV